MLSGRPFSPQGKTTQRDAERVLVWVIYPAIVLIVTLALIFGR